jgi:hypothetical protein
MQHDDTMKSRLSSDRSAMHTLPIEDAEAIRIAIRQEIQRGEESRCDHRLHGLPRGKDVTVPQSATPSARLYGSETAPMRRKIATPDGRLNAYLWHKFNA